MQELNPIPTRLKIMNLGVFNRRPLRMVQIHSGDRMPFDRPDPLHRTDNVPTIIVFVPRRRRPVVRIAILGNFMLGSVDDRMSVPANERTALGEGPS
ncbi:MAG: hypothetical protein ABL907_16980 [Hyphomicrobium sp.]